MNAFRSLRGRERLLRYGAWFFLLFAFAPNIFYLGHWSSPAEATHIHTESGIERQTEADGTHEQHCHNGPAKCGGGESTVGSLWAGEDAGLLVFSATPRQAPAKDLLLTIETLSDRLLQPPQAAA